MSGRLNCPECGAAFHEEFNPPSEAGTCDECGGELIQREDDKPEVIKERLSSYWEQTEPLKDYYDESGLLIEVDGEGTPAEVAERIASAVEDD